VAAVAIEDEHERAVLFGALRLFVSRARAVQRPDEAHRARRLIARLPLERVC
jgi:hypothetical protein